jgi:hypothetical protein
MLEVSFTGWGNCWYVRIPNVHVQKENIVRFASEVTGIFRLSPKDEEEYLRTKSFSHVKTMRPCLSPGSTFSKLVEEGVISKIDAEYCYFEVKQYREVYAPIPRQNVTVEVPNVFTVIEPDKKNSSPAYSIDPRLETTYLRIIGALYDYISGESPGIDAHPSFESQEKLIHHIVEKYGYRGLKKRTLEDKLAKAKRSFNDLD